MRRALAAAATLAVAAASTLTGPAPASAASRTTPTHVAVFVDGVGSACVPWRSGMTGSDLLGARFDVVYGQPTPRGNFAGLVVQINGVPKDPNPDSAYWAYFHGTGSGWQYSAEGPASYHPKPGSLDGWRLDSATTSAHPAPQPASYAAICAGQDPAPSATPRPTRTPARHQTPVAATRPAAGHAVAAVADTAPASGRPGRTRPARAHVSGHPTPPATRSPAVELPAATADASNPVSRYASSTPAALTHPASGGLPSWGTALAVALVLALGATAFWRSRSGHRTP